MIVVAIIALLASIAVPGFLRARKRAQAARILNDLRLIDSAIDQYAIETNKATGATVNIADWTAYMKKGSILFTTGKDLFGNTYGTQLVDSLPKVPASSKRRFPTWPMPPSGLPINKTVQQRNSGPAGYVG